MTDNLPATLKTAKEAERTAALLERTAACGEGGFRRRTSLSYSDIEALKQLAQRYRDYAKALHEMVTEEPAPEPEPEPDQGVML